MKRLFTFLFATMLVAQAFAYDFQSGDLYYNITSNTEPYTAEVTYINVGEVGDDYSSLTNITIPETATNSNDGITYSVKSIGVDAFKNCTGLTTVTIPNSVTEIKNNAFEGCSSLATISIPNTITTIGEGVFNSCNNLDYNTYDNCYYLGNNNNQYVVLLMVKNKNITSCDINTGCRIIYNNAFNGCNALLSIAIPNSVIQIGSFAFNGCSYLKSVSLPETISSIEKNTFNSCTSLTSITIPNSVRNIGDGAFANCWNCVSIIIPDGVITIGANAFDSNGNVKTVTIPKSVTSIGTGAFNTCRQVLCMASTPPLLDGDPFQNLDTVYVVADYVNAYKSATFWKRREILPIAYFDITATSADATKGSVTGSGNYIMGKNVSLTATPDANHHFVNWNDGNTDNPRVVSVSANATYTATFALDEFTISAVSTNNSMGSVSVEGYTGYGSTITLTATPAAHHHFVQWNDGNTTNPRTVTVTGNANYTATFAIDQFSVSATSNNLTAGSSYCSASAANYGEQVTFYATSNYGYFFTSWNNGSSANPYTATITTDTALTANYGMVADTITVIDSVHVEINDTALVEIYDTIHVEIYDTVPHNGDTIYIVQRDTINNTVTKLDTVYLFKDVKFVHDTVKTEVLVHDTVVYYKDVKFVHDTIKIDNVILDTIYLLKTDTIYLQTSVTEKNAIGLKVYPNPTVSFVTIDADAEFSFVLTDINGKLLRKEENAASYLLDLSEYPEGVYLLNTSDGATHKIVKK